MTLTSVLLVLSDHGHEKGGGTGGTSHAVRRRPLYIHPDPELTLTLTLALTLTRCAICRSTSPWLLANPNPNPSPSPSHSPSPNQVRHLPLYIYRKAVQFDVSTEVRGEP